MTRYPVSKVIAAMKTKRFRLFDNDTHLYNLNLIGVRATRGQSNVFDDLLYYFWWYRGELEWFTCPITTDPGTYWLQNPMNVKGTAILCPGQYLGLWEIGMHKDYQALVQKGMAKVWRDNNKDAIIDYGGITDVGVFGINLHHAGTTTKTVNKWSAGCQVFANVVDFNLVMKIVNRAAPVFGKVFSYTLLDEADVLAAEV